MSKKTRARDSKTGRFISSSDESDHGEDAHRNKGLREEGARPLSPVSSAAADTNANENGAATSIGEKADPTEDSTESDNDTGQPGTLERILDQSNRAMSELGSGTVPVERRLFAVCSAWFGGWVTYLTAVAATIVWVALSGNWESCMQFIEETGVELRVSALSVFGGTGLISLVSGFLIAESHPLGETTAMQCFKQGVWQARAILAPLLLVLIGFSLLGGE